MSIQSHQSIDTIDTDHGDGLNTESTKEFSFLPEPIIEGLISIASTSSSSSSSSDGGGSFDLLLELNKAQIDNHDEPTPKPNVPIDGPYEPPIKQSPPIQSMGRPNNVPGYDPNRIPSSVFASKPVNQGDWSVTSNESLFSIHMGNNSFSRDHAILLGKSEEFCKFDDLISTAPSQQQKPNEMSNSPYNLATVDETTSNIENYRQRESVDGASGLRKEADMTQKTGATMTVNIQNNNNNTKETVLLNNTSNISDGRETPTRDGTRTSASTNRISDGSGTNSSSSFAFPLLMGEAGNNAPIKTVHSPRENVQHRHIEKPKREPPPPPQQTHKSTPKAVGTRWFSWFSWFRTISFPRCSFCCR